MKVLSLLSIITIVTAQKDDADPRGTNKTLAPTPGVVRPPSGSNPPITPFPTEIGVSLYIFIYCVISWCWPAANERWLLMDLQRGSSLVHTQALIMDGRQLHRLNDIVANHKRDPNIDGLDYNAIYTKTTI